MRDVDLYEWQVAHIQKGLDAAKNGYIATDREIEEFFKQHGQS